MLTVEEFKKKFLVMEDGDGGAIANSTANVQALETEPIVRKKTQRKLVRRNASSAPKVL